MRLNVVVKDKKSGSIMGGLGLKEADILEVLNDSIRNEGTGAIESLMIAVKKKPLNQTVVFAMACMYMNSMLEQMMKAQVEKNVDAGKS